MHYVVTTTCTDGHEQKVCLQGVTREWAESYAGLLDGSSALYVYPPGADSTIGKCGICGKPITCTVEERAEAES